MANDIMLAEHGAIASTARGLLAILDPAEVRNELQALVISQGELNGLESALVRCRETDESAYSAIEKDEREKYLGNCSRLTRWYKAKRFKPSIVKQPSRQTALLETVLKISRDLQGSVQAYGELPETIAHMADEQMALEAQKAGLESELEAIRDFLTEWKKKKGGLYKGLMNYGSMPESEREALHRELVSHFKDGSVLALLDDEGMRPALAADFDTDYKAQEKKVATQYAIARNRYVSVTARMEDILSEAKSMKARLDPARIALNSLYDTYQSLALKARMRAANINLDSAIDNAAKRRREAESVLAAIEEDRQKARIEKEADGEVEKLVNGSADSLPLSAEEMCADIDTLLRKEEQAEEAGGKVVFRRK